jgi:hypothetical protein
VRAAGLLALAAVAAASACLAAPAAAQPPRPGDLQVAGGGDAWHADNRFALSWTLPAYEGGPAAIWYRVRDPRGAVIEERQLSRMSDGIGGLTLPKVPGIYGFEVWLEDADGERGQAATAQLRFDDIRPPGIELVQPPTWVGRGAFPLRVHLGHPPGPAPISGIGGYAVAIDAKPSGEPCAAADRCSADETSLKGGAGDDELAIASLPEGTSYLHAASVSGSGMKSATSASATLRVDLTDPVTRLAGAPDGWTNRPVKLAASASDGGSGMVAAGESPLPFTAIRVDAGAPTIAPGSSATARVIEEGAHRIAYYARDAAGNVDDGAARNGIPDRPPRTVWVRIDRSPPDVAFGNSQDPRDPDLLRVEIADPLSGPNGSRGAIAVRPAGSDDRFQPLPTASAGGRELRARWSSDAFPPGDYEFRAVGYDAAGNAAATTRRRNGRTMVLSNPLKATTSLRVGFVGHGERRTVPYGRRVRLGGRLITGRRSPLEDVPVRIVERFPAGAHPATRVSTVRTGPGGSFSFDVAAGPSRTIDVEFDGGPALGRSAARPLYLDVRSRVLLGASATVAKVGGAPLVFTGRLVAPAGTIPASGESVQLQFRLPGLPWSEFRTIRTSRRGRFRYAYRFSDDDSRGARFQFRAYVPAQEDWPFEPNGSRPVLIEGV